MPYIQMIVNGNGQMACYPNTNPDAGTVVTVRAFPYTGEILDTIVFYEYYNDDWHEVGVTQTDWRSWKFRIENNNMRVDALFTSRNPTPPDPPPPPIDPDDPPAPIYSNWLFAIIAKKHKGGRQ